MSSIQPAPHLQPSLVRPSLAASGRLLLFSDSPEYVQTHGVTYRDQAHRACRLFVHHVNATGAPVGIFIAWKNNRSATATVAARSSGAGWGPDPGLAGRVALWSYFRNRGVDSYPVAPGRWLRWGIPNLQPGHTFSGVYDFDLSAPLMAYVVMTSVGDNPDPEQLPLLTRDGIHVRGTWPHADRRARVGWSLDDGPTGVTLGAPLPVQGRPPDPAMQPLDGEFEMGYSGADRTLEMLAGNYGVVYHLELALANNSAGSRSVTLVLHPLGGEFYGAAEFAGYSVAMPAPIENPASAWYAWHQPLAPGERRVLPIRWLPPGGSSLPVRLLWFSAPGMVTGGVK